MLALMTLLLFDIAGNPNPTRSYPYAWLGRILLVLSLFLMIALLLAILLIIYLARRKRARLQSSTTDDSQAGPGSERPC